MRRHDHLVPSLLALALILTRLGMVARLADVFFYGEELEHATVAKAILDDVPIPLHLLAHHAHEGGRVVAAHVTAAAFHFVGENVLALKLVAITFTLATLIVGYWAGTRLFGRPAGLLFGILFVASPEPIQRLSLLNLGWHPESSFFVLLVGGLWSIATRVHVLLDVIESAQEDDLPSSFLVGVGRRVHARFYLDPRAALEFMTRIPEPARPFVEQGHRRAERLSLLGTSGDDWLDTPERGR